MTRPTATTATALDARDVRALRSRRPAALLLALALAATALVGCAGDASDAADDLEDPTSAPDAPGIDEPDGADVTATQFALPPLEVTNARGYPYEIRVIITHFGTEVTLGDPGNTTLNVEAEYFVEVMNLLDDRRAPFAIPSEWPGAVRLDLLFPMDEDLAHELHELRTAPLPGQGSQVPTLWAIDIGGSPFLRSVPDALGSDLATTGMSVGDLKASEVAVWSVWTVPFDAEATAPRAPSQAFGFDDRGWPEWIVAELDEVYAGSPAYVMLTITGGAMDVVNCRDNMANFQLVHYYDIAADEWRSPEGMPWASADCMPGVWKRPKE